MSDDEKKTECKINDFNPKKPLLKAKHFDSD